MLRIPQIKLCAGRDTSNSASENTKNTYFFFCKFGEPVFLSYVVMTSEQIALSRSPTTILPPPVKTLIVHCGIRQFNQFWFNSPKHQYHVCVRWQHKDWELLPPLPPPSPPPPPLEGMLGKLITSMAALSGFRREPIHPLGEFFRWEEERYMVGRGWRM